MAELSRSADQTISELQKTDPVKAGDCSSHVERLKVLIRQWVCYIALFINGSYVYDLLYDLQLGRIAL